MIGMGFGSLSCGGVVLSTCDVVLIRVRYGRDTSKFVIW